MYSSHSKNQRSLIESDQTKPRLVEETTSQARRSCQGCKTLRDKIPARLVLYFLSWSGFLVSFMMRNDINFALVAMVRSDEIKNKTALHVISRNEEHHNSTTTSNGFEYDWSSTVQSVILSSFYWCYVLSQVVGGIATQYFGTKNVFGWSQFATAACSLCIPWAADLHYGCVIALRSVQGFASGLTWPAMYAIVGPWIPFVERSRFMSSFQGFSIGIGLTYPLCGYIIEQFGWRYVFLTTGSLGMLWCVAWLFLAFNTPKQHPRITSEELQYIEDNVNAELNAEVSSRRVPWIAIFTSLPAWAIAITTFGRIWIHYIFIVSGPNFMKNILKFEYQTNGFLSGMPFICSYFSSLVFCFIADKMVLHFPLTLVRKIFTALSQVVPGLLVLTIGYINNVVLLLALWFIAVTLITASYAGAMANIVDIAPNFAGPVLAFCQTIHMSASFLSPLAAGLIVTNAASIDQWRIVFAVASVVACVTYLMYQFWGTAAVQKWNTLEQKDEQRSAEERHILQKAKKSEGKLNNNN